MFSKTLLCLRLEQKIKVDETIDYATAPLCRYSKGACLCKRQIDNEEVKCFYKNGPSKCCFEREEPKEILKKSKS